MASSVDVIQRIRELTVQAGNGSLSPNDRKSISSEMKERIGQLANIANTRDASGEYIFSGFQGSTAAFGKDASGSWVYQGDEGQRVLEIDRTTDAEHPLAPWPDERAILATLPQPPEWPAGYLRRPYPAHRQDALHWLDWLSRADYPTGPGPIRR